MFGPKIYNNRFKNAKFYLIVFVLFTASVFLIGNIITAAVKKTVHVDKKSYELKKGFPIFTDQKQYIELVRNYPHDIGAKLTIHKTRYGESLWDICHRHTITIDTLIAANPFLTSLSVSEGTEIVVPERDGVLLAFDDFLDVLHMSSILKYKNKILGDYLPTPFKLISTDDIRFVFFENSRPMIVNDSLERLNNYRNLFQPPLVGFYTSMFGDRVDPFYHENMEFHNGIDIMARMGTPIRPAKEGMVIHSGWRDGYGLSVIIQHADGYSTLYGHLSSIKTKAGDWVNRDDIIGLCGSTGRSTGSHLHLMIMRHGEVLNPILFIW